MSYLNKIFCILCVLILAVSLAACGGQPAGSADPVNIAFVLAPADGEIRFDTGIAELANLPNAPGSTYAFISAEGETAAMTEPGTVPDLSSRGYNSEMLGRAMNSMRADLAGKLTAYTPSSKEIDVAGAIELGIRCLRMKAQPGRQNILCLYLSGKSTSGLIDLTRTSVSQLSIMKSADTVAQKMCVDASGIDVFWYGCGVLGAQDKFAPEEKGRLQDFYGQLFRNLNARSVTFYDTLPGSAYYAFPDQPVSAIDTTAVANGLEADEELLKNLQSAPETLLEAPLLFPDSLVQHKPDSAEFLNPQTAAETIRPVAELMQNHPELRVLVYGTCAGDADSDYTLRLGKARAEKFREVLIEAGISPDRIVAITVRVADDPFHEFGKGTGPAGAVNRKTVLMNLTSDLAQQLLSKSW